MRNVITYPAYLPDQLPRGVLTVAENVYPAQNGYRAVKSLVTVSDPLPASFRGGAAFIASDGTGTLLAGTANGLTKLTASSWTSLLVGMSVSGRWKFTQFGDYVIAVNGGETKVVDLIAGTASALTGAPTARDVSTVGDQVVCVGADGNALKVRWSAFNDHTGWTPGTDQSGFQPMLTGGEIKGIAGGEYGIILQRFRLVRMERTGDSTAPFSFAEITPNFGCASAGSIAQAGRTVFFLSDRGFMALEDGASLKPIGNEKFDNSFKQTVSVEDYENLWAAVDPKRSLVFWGVAGSPGRIWVYNWVLDRATTLSFPFSGFFTGYSASQTLEQVSATYPNLDMMPYSLDDPRFQGGDPQLYVVDANGALGSLAGPNLGVTLKLGMFEPFGEQRARLRALWPVGDAISGVSLSVDARQRLGDAEAVTASGVMQQSGRVPIRVSGRSMAITHQIAAGAAWNYVQGVELEADTGGGRA